MPIREILQLGHPVLRQIAQPVPDPTAPAVTDLVTDLADTVGHWRATTGYGRAIAAPQIGELQRVILLRLPGRPVWAAYQPQHHRPQPRENDGVGCLPVLPLHFHASRALRVDYCALPRPARPVA
ncbi:peptide deformylase [Hymenobacter wooponensis]|uniref:peptide deformylase n=1 Tax=Hymenobacter wooponensis TaxID=1525360 RepID=UPI001AEBF322|nr:peptide deformylase [Hymenobacter wooponensis]